MNFGYEVRENIQLILDTLDDSIQLIVSGKCMPYVVKGIAPHTILFRNHIPVVIMLMDYVRPVQNIISEVNSYHILSYNKTPVVIQYGYLTIREVRDRIMELITIIEDQVGFIVSDEFLEPTNKIIGVLPIVSMEEFISSC